MCILYQAHPSTYLTACILLKEQIMSCFCSAKWKHLCQALFFDLIDFECSPWSCPWTVCDTFSSRANARLEVHKVDLSVKWRRKWKKCHQSVGRIFLINFPVVWESLTESAPGRYILIVLGWLFVFLLSFCGFSNFTRTPLRIYELRIISVYRSRGLFFGLGLISSRALNWEIGSAIFLK